MPDQSPRLVFALCWFVLLQSGCGPKGLDLGPFGLVTGRVTYRGRPVAQGMITFNCPQTGHVATAKLQADGSYAMRLNDREGLPLGKYKVCVRPPLVAREATDPSQARRNNLYDPSISKDIPMKYRYESSSRLEVIVKEGVNHFEFDLIPSDG